ncbi:MAG: hypothetical protein GX216_06765 [Methanomicrobiales archaeon]|nr:hypothetical protein [Methanomicrobiales archaeon]
MSEKRGHFERGRWVEDPEPAPQVSVAGSTGSRPTGASDAQTIEEAARRAGEELERAIDAWAESARKSLQRR